MSDGIADRELIGRIRSDPAALAALYQRHVRRVIRFAAKRCSEPQDAADLVAATFVEVLESAHTYDPGHGEVLHGSFGIEEQAARRPPPRNHREGSEVLARSIEQQPLDEDEYARLEEQLDAARVGGAVGRALTGLDDGERDVLLLAGYEELTSREAAAVLGISPTAFRMRLSRARRSLAKALERDQEGDAVPAAAAIKEEL